MPKATPEMPNVQSPTLEFDKPLTSALAPIASDSSTYEAHLAHLQKSYTSGKYTISSVQIILEETAETRRQWIKEERPSVTDIVEKFPCFKDPKFVSK